MEFNKKNLNGIIVIEFKGELDDYTANSAKKSLNEIMKNNEHKNFLFDLKELEFMDSSGIGMLLSRYKAVKRSGGSICVTNISEQIDKVFKVSGLYQVFKKVDNL